MSGPVAGFFGKIPARGDFVRANLPRPLVAALDAWLQAVIPASQALLGREDWTACWMEAPVWRFHLAPDGGGPAAGLLLPSTDRAGRLFPLVVALAGGSAADVVGRAGFLDAAEGIALAAIERDAPPDGLATALSDALAAPPAPLPPAGTWWTAGSRLVAPGSRTVAGLPDAATFAGFLRDG